MRAVAELSATSAEARALWSKIMHGWVAHATAKIEAEREVRELAGSFAVVTTVKPVAPTKMTPPAPPGPAPPSTAVGEVCPNIGSVGGQLEDSFQQIADNEGLSESHVTVEFTVSPAGVISGARIVSSDAPSLNALALQGVMNDLRCNGQSQTVNVLAPFDFVPN